MALRLAKVLKCVLTYAYADRHMHTATNEHLGSIVRTFRLSIRNHRSEPELMESQAAAVAQPQGGIRLRISLHDCGRVCNPSTDPHVSVH